MRTLLETKVKVQTTDKTRFHGYQIVALQAAFVEAAVVAAVVAAFPGVAIVVAELPEQLVMLLKQTQEEKEEEGEGQMYYNE